jgi:HK97 family phage major capsid protein
MSTEKILKAVTELQDNQKKLSDRLDELAKPKEADARKGGIFNIRKGEDPLTSRGYSFTKLFQAIGKQISPDHAKVEVELANRLQKLYVDQLGFQKAEANTVMAPFASSYIAQLGEENLASEIRDVVKAGVTGYDREELMQLRAQKWGVQKALSWVDESSGAALVGPPMMGELIEVLRNNEALMAAGCRTIAMPPNGRVTFPRQTGASSAYWVGESTTVTDSTPATGDLVLAAKKLGVLIKIPNELFRFSSVSVEMFVREDIARVAALKLDKDLLEGVGGSVSPKGLINYAGIKTHTAKTVGTDGNTFQPEDVANMIAEVEENNAIFRSFLMRPLMYAALVNRRADAITAGDAKGPFVFNIMRHMEDNMNLDRMRAGSLYGYPAIKSTQISNTRVKGSGTNLSYILGGDFTDYILTLGGVIEFQISTQGDTPFTTDQTWIRGIQYVDGGPRHEASFNLCDNLLVA